MSEGPQKSINRAIVKIMRPLVRVMLRNGLAFADFAALVKGIFVEVASEDFDLPGKKQSVSRISVITGINRKEVKRLMELPPDSPDVDNNNRAARVVSGWMRDSAFTDTRGKPVNDGTVMLTSTGYVPSTSNDEMLRLAAEGASDLLNTVDYNLQGDNEVSRLQLSVAYDDIPDDGVELFRNLSREKSIELLTSLDQFLATQDRSVNPSIEGEGRYRTGIGIYYFEEEVVPDSIDTESGDDTKKDKGQRKR